MGQEIARLNMQQQQKPYGALSDDEDGNEGNYQQNRYNRMRNNPGSMGSYGSFNNKQPPNRAEFAGYGFNANANLNANMNGDQLMSLPNPLYGAQRVQYTDSKAGTKRNSLISVNSASDFNQKYVDIHKQTLFSAAKILENMLNESGTDAQYNGYSNNNNQSGQNPAKLIDEEYRKKLDDVMQMIFTTMRVWDYLDLDGVEQGFGGHRLTLNNVMKHDKNDREEEDPAALLTPDDAYETTKTLGGMSMVSATSSAAMEQRKAFLKKASHNHNVRRADRVMAKHIAQTYLTSTHDTPHSVLSQSQLPFFGDEEESDEEEQAQTQTTKNGAVKSQSPTQQHSPHSPGHEQENGGVGHRRKSSLEKENRVTSAEIRCEQRVLRWKQNTKLQEYLAQIHSWDFDVFYVVENAGNYAMPACFLTLAESRGLIQELNLNVTNLCNYFHQISMEYKNNAYHNSFHGVDVLVNCNYFLNAKLMRNIRPLDQFACLVAAATHDVGHPGNNNGFEIERESDVATTYNDISVLESMHVALAWQVLKRPGCNILNSLDRSQRKQFRKLMIDSVLNTDMSKHAEQQKLLAELIDCVTNSGIDLDHLDHQELNDEDKQPGDDKKLSRRSSLVSISNIPPNSIYADPAKFAKVVIPLMVHTADLSNPSKDLKLYYQWAQRVVQEFFAQAENEKKLGLPVSAFMDKDQTDFPTIQVGFLNHVVRPWFDLWGRLLRDKNQGPLHQFNVTENLKHMQTELEKLRNAKEEQKAQADKEKKQQEEEDKKRKLMQVARSVSSSNIGMPLDPKAIALIAGPEVNGLEEQVSVVDMTFEDISRVEMMDKMQRMEELKSRQKAEYYHMDQQAVDNGLNNVGLHFTDLNKDDEYDNDYVPKQRSSSLQYDEEDDAGFHQPLPMGSRNSGNKKKKMLYTGSQDNSSGAYNGGAYNANNDNNNANANNGYKRKSKKKKTHKQSKNPRELNTIPEVI